MGSTQSTRRLSIDNDSDPSSVIKVSNAVVERLKNGGESLPTDEIEEDSPQNAKKVRQSPISSNISKIQPSAGKYEYFAHPFITSHQIRQEIEKEIEENNAYWEKRISRLQADQEKMNKVMEEEYTKSATEIEQFLPRLPPGNAKVPCLEKRGSVISCYLSNTKQPLLCAKEVEAFTCCMTNTRVKLQCENKLG